MLADLPIEILVNILQHLRQRDVGRVSRSCKDLNSIAAPLLDTAVCTSLAQCSSFVAYILNDSTSVRARRLRDVRLLIPFGGCNLNDAAEYAGRLLKVLELSRNITQLSIHHVDVFHQFQAGLFHIILSLPSLLHLELATLVAPRRDGHNLDSIVLTLPVTLRSLSLATVFGTLPIASALFPLSRLTDLHTVKLTQLWPLTDDAVAGADPIPSVRNLTLDSTKLFAFSPIFFLFPHLHTLRLRGLSVFQFGESPCPPIVRLPRLQVIQCPFTYETSRLHVSWLQLFPDIEYGEVRNMRVAETGHIGDLRKITGYLRSSGSATLGVSMGTSTFGETFWREITQCTPGARWMEVWVDSKIDDGLGESTVSLMSSSAIHRVC